MWYVFAIRAVNVSGHSVSALANRNCPRVGRIAQLVRGLALRGGSVGIAHQGGDLVYSDQIKNRIVLKRGS